MQMIKEVTGRLIKGRNLSKGTLIGVLNILLSPLNTLIGRQLRGFNISSTLRASDIWP